MNLETENFLRACSRNGIDLVAIRCTSDRIKSSWVHAGLSDISAFADARGKDGFPAIWQAAKDAGISVGCGNDGQAQLDKWSPVESGVYEVVDGIWTLL